MSLTQFSLGNGIRLHYYPTNKFKNNELSISFLLPLEKETVSLNALLPSVLTHASEHYPTLASLNDHLNDLYGTTISINTEKVGDIFSITLSFVMLQNKYIPTQLDLHKEILNLLEELLCHPLIENGSFSRKIVNIEKEKAIAAIESLIDNKRAYANVRLIDEMCKQERYSIRSGGTTAQVAEITPETLYEHLKTVYKTAKIECFFIGNCDIDALASSLTTMFSGWERSPISLPSTERIEYAKTVQEVEEIQSAKQSNLVMGFRGVPRRDDLKDYATFLVFCDLYGMSPTGKLFMNVREKKSLCYFCRASARAAKGILLVQAGIAAENKSIAQEEILHQLSLCQQGEISDSEIQLAKREIKNMYRTIFDHPASMQSYYLDACIMEIPYDIPALLQVVDTITREEIATIANRLTLDTVFFLKGIEEED